MATEAEQNKKIEFVPCRFKFHDFTADVGEVRMQCQVMMMSDSIYLYVGEQNNSVMNDMSLAICWQSNNIGKEKNPVTTKVMGSLVDETSSNIAARLSKKTGQTVYVSFNLQVDNLSLPGVEKRIHEEFKNNPNLLSSTND